MANQRHYLRRFCVQNSAFAMRRSATAPSCSLRLHTNVLLVLMHCTGLFDSSINIVRTTCSVAQSDCCKCKRPGSTRQHFALSHSGTHGTKPITSRIRLSDPLVLLLPSKLPVHVLLRDAGADVVCAVTHPCTLDELWNAPHGFDCYFLYTLILYCFAGAAAVVAASVVSGT